MPDLDPNLLDDDNKPKLVKVTVAGQEYEVTPEMATAMEAQNRATEERMQAMEQNLLQELRSMASQSPAPAPQPSTDQSYGDLSEEDLQFYSSPTKAMQAKLAEMESSLLGKLEQKNNLVEAQRRFWKGFYDSNRHLREHDEFVRMLWETKKHEYASLNFEQTWKKFGEAVDASMAKLLKGHTVDEPNDRTTVTGSQFMDESGVMNFGQPTDVEKKAKGHRLIDSLRKMKEDREKHLSKTSH